MKKVVISPTDKKAIAFFAKLNEKKEALRIRVEAKLKETAQLVTKGR